MARVSAAELIMRRPNQVLAIQADKGQSVEVLAHERLPVAPGCRPGGPCR
jgi:hypothetical protein